MMIRSLPSASRRPDRSPSALSLALLAAVTSLVFLVDRPPGAHAQTDVEITSGFAPPPLPLYDQPPLPGPDYLWSPGYWAWDGDAEDYYWVPGAWVLAPEPGYLWTPAWWGWDGGLYVFHPGYWGRHVGYYGGVAYGYGYTGSGFYGGYWNGGHYVYNRAVNHLSGGVAAYQGPAPAPGSRASFSGGPGGAFARPSPEAAAAAREAHFPATPQQTGLARSAAASPAFFSRANRGAPPQAAAAAPYPVGRSDRSFGGGQAAPRGGAYPGVGAGGRYEGSGGGSGGGFGASYAPRTTPSPYASPAPRPPGYGGGPATPAYGGGAQRSAAPIPPGFSGPSGPQPGARPAQRPQPPQPPPPAPKPAAERRASPARGSDPHDRF